MAIKKYLTAKSGTYKNKQGEEKNSYTRCGVLMETKNGDMIKLEALPINFDGWLYMQDPEPRIDKKQDEDAHF